MQIHVDPDPQPWFAVVPLPLGFLKVFGEDISVSLGELLSSLLLLVLLGKKIVQIPHVADENFYTKIEETMITAGREYFNQYH